MLDDGAARLRRTVDELGSGASHTTGAKDGKEAAYQRRIAELEAQVRKAGFIKHMRLFCFPLEPYQLSVVELNAQCVMHGHAMSTFQSR